MEHSLMVQWQPHKLCIQQQPPVKKYETRQSVITPNDRTCLNAISSYLFSQTEACRMPPVGGCQCVYQAIGEKNRRGQPAKKIAILLQQRITEQANDNEGTKR
jgi:hypothetical protein